MFLLFMAAELIAILILYQFVIIPRVAEKTNNLFEQRMLACHAGGLYHSPG